MAYMVKRPGSLAIQTFSREELAARAARGEIKRDWLVRTETGGAWERMDEAFEAAWPAEAPPAHPNNEPSEEQRYGGSAPPAGAASSPSVVPATAPPMLPPSARMVTETQVDSRSRWTKAVMKRYRDAYRVAAFIVTLGGIVKGIGIAAGALFFLFFLLGIGGGIGGGAAALGVGALVLAIVVGGLFLIFGIVISAQGQALRAGLDVAVYESPFLNDEERAKVMSL